MASDRIQRRIDILLDEADASVSKYDWEAVRQAANAVLAIAPDNSDATTFLAAADRALSGSASPAATQPAVSKPAPAPIATAAQPASFADNRYRVNRVLGEGGKKRVYLTHDTLLDREVAFALIKTEGLDEAGRGRIQREAQAMGRLGSHPHIVTVFDLGEEHGQPYMVTELMGGGDVEGVIEDAEDHRLPLEQAIKIAQETCQGLEFAHSRGIVHRDLKPGNVWLTEDGLAKIGDFGLAVALDRSRLTTEGMMVGTVSYMPPEQAMGGQVTPQSDLYSLGAMLYEMVTGRPPFLGDDAVAIIGQHINTPPVAPTWHNGQCPRPLDALILRLLAKDPSERPESASDVLSALNAIDIGDVGAMHASPLQDDYHALDSLAGGVFVGRKREMGELKAYLEDSLSGRGRLVTLVGEPGIGKTRTAQELATYAGLRHAQVLWGRCYEGEGAPPYWPWVQAIRSYVRDVDPEQLRSDMGAGAADIGEVVSDVRDRLPGLQAPPQLEPEQARFRLFDSITAFLKSAGRRQPLVLVLDDLHWADHPSLLLLEFVARELSNARLLIIGTYRDVELSRQHPLSRSLGELTRERLFQRVLLRGLDQEDVGRFIELVSGITPPIGMLEAVHGQTEGNPLFVTEVVRLLVQEEEFTQEKAGQRDSWSVRIPEGVREVIGRRLDRLSERCNETLTIASVVGREFTLDQLSPLIEDISGDRLLDVLDEALSARVIEELPQSVGRYQFTHALIQETLAEELSTTRRVRLHGRIAQVLEELYGADVEAHAAELAHHFAEAQSVTGTEKLVRYSALAGERALSTYGYEEAQAHFERALAANEGQETDAGAAPLLFGLGRAQGALFQRREALASLNSAFDHYAGAGDIQGAVSVAEYPINPGMGRVRVTHLISRALALVPPDSHQAGNLLSRYGLALGNEMGDYSGGEEAFDKALTIARRDKDVALELRVLANSATVDFLHLRWQDCVEKGLRAVELSGSGKGGDPQVEVTARFWAGLALAYMGDLDGAQQQQTAALFQAERLRHRGLLATVLVGKEVIAHLTGDWRSAREFIDQGLAAVTQEARLLSVRVLLEYDVGEFEQGEVYLQRFLEVTRRTAPGPTFEYGLLSIVLPVVARITGAANREDIAEAAAKAILASPSAIPLFTMYARGSLALLAMRRADVVAATAHYNALRPLRGMVFPGNAIVTDDMLGLLAQTMGNFAQSTAHFEDALAFCRKAGYRPGLAWICCNYADMLRERDGEGDRTKAMTLLDESLAISSELGMRPLMERVLYRREILGA